LPPTASARFTGVRFAGKLGSVSSGATTSQGCPAEVWGVWGVA
jgi:hypothetical protein